MDEVDHMIYGGAFFVLDIVLLFVAFSSPRIRPFSLRVCMAYFCIVDMIFNTLHVAQGLRYEWATPALRHHLLALVIFPQLAVGLFAWMTLERSRKQNDAKDA